MVEKDTVGGEKIIALTIIPYEPIGINLGRSIWTARLKRCLFILRGWCSTIHFTGGSLVKSGFYPGFPDGFE
jgi:hypothetical protein